MPPAPSSAESLPPRPDRHGAFSAARIHDIAVKTLIAAEHSIVSKVNQAGRPACFELFGFDILLDAHLKPWLIEVNVACSLASSSPLDKLVKHSMMTDLLHLVGIVPYDRRRTTAEDDRSTRRNQWQKAAAQVRGNERPLKHRNIFELRETPLHELDRDDLDIIAAAEDEHTRRGGWQRIFPCAGMSKEYLPLFEFPRYRNTVRESLPSHAIATPSPRHRHAIATPSPRLRYAAIRLCLSA